MTQQEGPGRKNPAEQFNEMIRTFGDAMSEIFSDPELKEKAGDFADSVKNSAKNMPGRLKEEDTKARFRQVGKEAEDFGKSIKDYFKDKVG